MLRPGLTKRPFPPNPGSRCGHGLLGRGVHKHSTLAVKTMLSRGFRICEHDEAGWDSAEGVERSHKAEAAVCPQNACQAL